MSKRSTAGGPLLYSLASIGLLILVVLGYGYWHAATHASFQVDLYRLTPAGERQPMPLADVVFLDDRGRPLAKGISDDKYHVHLLHPEVGDCYALESAATTSRAGRTAWQDCYARLSTWTPEWVEKVHSVSVSDHDKLYEQVPVKLNKYNADWLLWWVPLPHVGGKPTTYYSGRIVIESSD